MKDYDHIYQCYLDRFLQCKNEREEYQSRSHSYSDEELGYVIKDLDYFQAIGYMLDHNESGGQEEYLTYLDKFRNYNWWRDARKYMGKERADKYQKLRDAAYLLKYIRPDLEVPCTKLIHSIEKDVANDVRKLYPELDIVFPIEKQITEQEIPEDDYMAGYRAGWNTFSNALLSAHNSESDVNHLIYTMHEIAKEYSHILAMFWQGQDDMRSEYEEYLYYLDLYEKKHPDNIGKPRPVEVPDELPPDKTYEEVLFEQVRENDVHRVFNELVQHIEKPDLSKVQKDAIKRFKGMTEKPEQER